MLKNRKGGSTPGTVTSIILAAAGTLSGVVIGQKTVKPIPADQQFICADVSSKKEGRINLADYFLPEGKEAIVRVMLPVDTGYVNIDIPIVGEKQDKGWGNRIDVKVRQTKDILTENYIKADSISAATIAKQL
jgi:hypothetical protein